MCGVFFLPPELLQNATLSTGVCLRIEASLVLQIYTIKSIALTPPHLGGRVQYEISYTHFI